MEKQYLFTSAQGDVPVDRETLQRPFLLRPFENHPFLTLGDFFQAVSDFFFQDIDVATAGLLSQLWGREVGIEELERTLIRYEKYGSLYQMASVEVLAGEHRTKFAVSAALAPEAKVTLDHEFELLKGLNRRYRRPYLPEVYFRDEVKIQKGEEVDGFVMSLSEWFEGFHEWHFTGDPAGRGTMTIWDQERGYRPASAREAREIIRQASKILTFYYDTETYRQIFPWHHGAGDFVARSHEGGADVRLVTVRGYEPIVSSVDGEEIDPLTAIAYFFLNMTIKMRLDKSEGMGEPLWAPAYILPAVIEGFIEALRTREAEGDYHAGKVMHLIELLRSLRKETLNHRLYALMLSYRQHDPVDSATIEKNLEDHAGELYQAIQGGL